MGKKRKHTVTVRITRKTPKGPRTTVPVTITPDPPARPRALTVRVEGETVYPAT